MRKYFLFPILALAVLSCNDDDPGSSSSFPTDDLNPEPVTKAMIGLVYSSNTSGAGGIDVIRENFEAKFGDDLNHMTLVSTAGDNLYSAAADSVIEHYNGSVLWNFFLNGEVTNILDYETAVETIETAISEKPPFGLAHTVVNTDTGYAVYVKVKAFEDTTSPFFYVQTYALADVQARLYDSGNLDLRQGADNMFLENNDNNTFWKDEIKPIDSTLSVLYSKDEVYTHKYVMLSSFDKENAFGINLSEYSKFGPEFYTNDLIGLEQSPIIHYFLDEEFEDIKYTYTPKFLSVIWSWDFVNQRYTYVNSYMD